MKLIRAHISYKLLLVGNRQHFTDVSLMCLVFDGFSVHCKSHQAVELRSLASDEKVHTMSAEPSDVTGHTEEHPAAPVRHRRIFKVTQLRK